MRTYTRAELAQKGVSLDEMEEVTWKNLERIMTTSTKSSLAFLSEVTEYAQKLGLAVLIEPKSGYFRLARGKDMYSELLCASDLSTAAAVLAIVHHHLASGLADADARANVTLTKCAQCLSTLDRRFGITETESTRLQHLDESDRECVQRMGELTHHMDGHLRYVRLPTYDTRGNLVEPVIAIYTTPPALNLREMRFNLPKEIQELKRTVAAHQQVFRAKLQEILDDAGVSVLHQFQNPQHLKSLQRMAELAGGTLIASEKADENGVFTIVYRRYQRLKAGTLTEAARKLPRTVSRYLASYRRSYVFVFNIPFEYDTAYRLLENDVRVYAGLPPEKKRPTGWKPKYDQ